MVPNIGSDSVLLLGYSISYTEHTLTGFSHQKKRYSYGSRGSTFLDPFEVLGGRIVSHRLPAARVVRR